MKRCPRCEQHKPGEEFGTRSKTDLRLRSWCRPCTAEYYRVKYKAHPRPRPHPLQKRAARYGLTAEEATALLAGNCQLCGEAPATHIDHDHSTGKVRGGLCHNCNVGLGHFKDRTDLLGLAQQYLLR